MKWLLPALGSTALAAFVSQASVTVEPPTGVEVFFHGDRAGDMRIRLGTLQIDGIERAVSARVPLSVGDARRSVSLPPGLYGLSFTPDPASEAPAVSSVSPAVLLVTPRNVTRVHLEVR